MGKFPERLSEQLAIVGCVDPDANSAGDFSTDVVDMRYHRRVMFVIMVGDMAASSTVDFKVYEGTTNSPATEITAKRITQLTQAGTDADKQVVVEVAAEDMTPGCRYLKGTLTVGTDAVDAAVLALADVSRYEPANAYDLASVDEIVA